MRTRYDGHSKRVGQGHRLRQVAIHLAIVVVVAAMAVAGGTHVALADSGCVTSGNTVTCTYVFVPASTNPSGTQSQGVEQTFTKPAGITAIDVTAVGGAGASGGASDVGGPGAKVTATLSLPSASRILYIEVAGNGIQGSGPGSGGFNGGGNGGFGEALDGGGGGGASDIRTVSSSDTTNTLSSRLLVAAGGGGGEGYPGAGTGGTGGAGGSGSSSGGIANGAPGTCGGSTCGGGGGTSTGGTAGQPDGVAGSFGAGGSGDPSSDEAGFCGGGGGGGGYYGGGGGGSGCGSGHPGGGGGGGSSLIPSGGSASLDTSGTPLVIITYGSDTTPPMTSITLSPPSPNGQNGWYTSGVHITVSASDNTGGSGVAETRCVLDPASAPASFDDIPAGCAYTGVGAGADVSSNGLHTLYAASSDYAGNKETPTSQAFKIDTTAPTLSLPSSSVTADATGPSGASVSYSVTASDPDNASGLTVGCSPASGSTFEIGTTTVNCSASDPAGNSIAGSFSVVVVGASGQLSNLQSQVVSFGLGHGPQTAFDSQLNAVQADLAPNNTGQACSDLQAFMSHVNAQSGKQLTTDEATQLLAAAAQIQAVIGC